MDITWQKEDKQNKPKRVLLLRLRKFWTRCINIGIYADTSKFDRKRTRILNTICLWTSIIYFLYMAQYANMRIKIVFIEASIGFTAACIPIAINYFRKYNAACHSFNILNLLVYLFMSISQGGRDDVEYIFAPICVAAMLLFRSPLIITVYFLLNLAAFGLAKLSYVYMKPMFVFAEQKNLAITNTVIMFVILFAIVYYFKHENETQEAVLSVQNEELSEEKAKSDNLLLNILPYETAEELKQTGVAKPRHFDMVTVMFTDFKNFTQIAEELKPEELVAEINYCYSNFDSIVSKYNIEKIKTIGDSYMCAGGIPQSNTTNPCDVVCAALEMQDFMLQHKAEKIKAGKCYFEIRLGIHTGPVVAGVVGIKKFAYDIWGDTVNIASRMESGGEVGRVNITGYTYELIKDRFICHHRGSIPVKNKGLVEMYFVDGVV